MNIFCIKKLVLLLLLFIWCDNLFAQKDSIKFDIEFNAGFARTLAPSGQLGNEENQYINVGFHREIIKSLNLRVNAKNIKYKHAILGAELGLDEFTYGYLASTKSNNPLITGGSADLAPNDRVILYKFAPVIGYEFPISKRFHIRTTLHPTLAYFPFSHRLQDTANDTWWQHPTRDETIWFFAHPSKQNNGFHFLFKSQLAMSYKFSKHTAGIFSLAYQQGLTTFVEDRTNIFMPNHPDKDNKIYYTKVNGPSWQFHFGFRYYLNKPESIVKTAEDIERKREKKAQRQEARKILAAKKFNFDVELSGGLQKPIIGTGDKQSNEFITIGQRANISNSINFAMFAKKVIHSNVVLGLELGKDDFSYEYRAHTTANAPIQGASVGRYIQDQKINLYRIAPIIGYDLKLSNKWNLRTTFNPTLGFYPYSNKLNETNNSLGSESVFYRDVWLVRLPATQNSGLHFLAKAQTTISYSFNNRIAAILSLAYQKGFNDFIIDNTQIYMPSFPDLDNKVYKTSIDGTSFQSKIGLRYNLNL